MAALFIWATLITSALIAGRPNHYRTLASTFFILALLAYLHIMNHLSLLDWPLWLFTILAIVLLMIQHWFTDKRNNRDNR
ncbi:hypothetical protein [Schleiferilactobacillus harbinensis]|uniref:hypothetical protein n=1 Tax=Schleiferilactobacillus harbinensis TaxID=304207 RepID=UPI0011708216|nr:hypothetical protein [Schleiferilactobacillus harbinensis]MCI1688387.1 hypothetical protein [Schleiferilactobacillus harbinensis]MCI1782309.1 hypothetical protein [Schleiferilactobacillus harbinensis]MCI1850176.1 hypothetical protein [Schleiferilactobacillus harbinensis]QEU46779.1 hypothetical protein FMM01_05445 [Schleiferilactobacillus harbinensis]GEK05911.1 hypothetical protein LHA01_11500 [Schleiferilactobacillus harbinensis]